MSESDELEAEAADPDDSPKCEGCGAPATARDLDDVPLCMPCAKALVDEQAPPRFRNFKGGMI